MPKPNCILSPCGISLLLNFNNQADSRAIINNYANTKTINDVQSEDIKKLEALLSNACNKLNEANLEIVQKLSAELNGIIKFYGGVFVGHAQDIHWLLCTDTWLGHQVATYEQTWLNQQGILNVQIYSPSDLQTQDIDAFQTALSDIVKWCEDTIKPYLDTHHVVFNLTGGFKSVQGFLQTLATFYAHESVYVFETANDLLRIPKLPVKMDLKGVISDKLAVFRKFACGLPVQPLDVSDIPDTLFLKVDGEVALSVWGELAWSQTYRDIYQEKLFPPPSSQIKYSDTFEPSLNKIEKARLITLNYRIDQLANYLNSGHNPRSLDFKKLKGNPQPPSTHEIDAWADGGAKRLFGHYDGEVFVLDKLGDHL